MRWLRDGFSAQSYTQGTGRICTAADAPSGNNGASASARDLRRADARNGGSPNAHEYALRPSCRNDPTYIEPARTLAQRTVTEGGKDVLSRIGYAFREATARKPSSEEMKVLRELLQRQLTNYRRDKKAALELLGVGESKWDEKLDASELAAWTTVASAILNLDETITKE